MSGKDGEERAASGPIFGKGTLVVFFAWGLVVLAFSVGGLADVTRFWWLVLLFGAASPVALVAMHDRTSRRDAGSGARRAERELLGALRERGQLTPTAAAMLTPLTAAEAAKTLEKLAGEGRLKTRVVDGTIAYALRAQDRLSLSERPPDGVEEIGPIEATSVEPPGDLLSGRELAVLELLADGNTNKEIARTLFVAQGTVKAHVASVYRKLDVHSRAEAVSRARDLGLLG